MFAVVVWLDVIDNDMLGGLYNFRLLDVKFWGAPLMWSTTKFAGQVWHVLLPSMASRPNTALVMNVFTKEVKCCPAFPSPDESASDWTINENGYFVEVKK